MSCDLINKQHTSPKGYTMQHTERLWRPHAKSKSNMPCTATCTHIHTNKNTNTHTREQPLDGVHNEDYRLNAKHDGNSFFGEQVVGVLMLGLGAALLVRQRRVGGIHLHNPAILSPVKSDQHCNQVASYSLHMHAHAHTLIHTCLHISEPQSLHAKRHNGSDGGVNSKDCGASAIAQAHENTHNDTHSKKWHTENVQPMRRLERRHSAQPLFRIRATAAHHNLHFVVAQLQITHTSKRTHTHSHTHTT